MKPGKIIIYSIIYFSALSEILASAGTISARSSREIRASGKSVNFLPGVKLFLSEDGVFLNVNFRDFFAMNEEKGREGDSEGEGESKKKTGLVKKIGRIMMMMPLVMQILRLPSEIAEIKVSLIRSILVAKMALIMIIFNAIRNARKSETVVVHQPPQQQLHEHYYHEDYFHEPEDDDQGWLG